MSVELNKLRWLVNEAIDATEENAVAGACTPTEADDIHRHYALCLAALEGEIRDLERWLSNLPASTTSDFVAKSFDDYGRRIPRVTLGK